MINIKYNLVYHQWIPNEPLSIFSKKVVDYHWECLNRISRVFNKVTIYLAYDKFDRDLHKYYVDKVLKTFPIENLVIKVVPNTCYRESSTYYQEILESKSSDYPTFFCHSKGMTNDNHDLSTILHWIGAMYYYNVVLESRPRYLFENTSIASGIFQWEGNLITNVNHWIYSGSFYWLHTKKFWDHLTQHKKSLPKLTDRCWSEQMLGSCIDPHYTMKFYQVIQALHDHHVDLYTNCDSVLAWMNEEDGELDNFYRWHSSIMSNIN